MTKGPTLQKARGNPPGEQSESIKVHTEELKAEYRTLHELRKETGLTQIKVSKILDMPQSNVSRLEKNSDMLLSTLRTYVEAIGGKLNLTVEMPDKKPIVLGGLGDLVENINADNS